jgi:hypothetical protein
MRTLYGFILASWFSCFGPVALAADPPAPPAAAGTSSSEYDQYVRTKLSTLWTVQSLNIVATDVLSSMIPGWREELERFAGGKEKVKWYMLAGTLIYEIPISMIFFSRYLDRDANRWANVGAAGVTAALLVGGGNGEPHYYVMATIEVITLAYIAWTALQWEPPTDSQAALPARIESPASGLRLLADPITGACGLSYALRF